MNKMVLTNRLNQLSHKTGVNYNLLLLKFFMEEFLVRISLSPYRNDFVFKGGFLLSSLFGISNRTTMDMDILIRNHQFEKKQLESMLAVIIESYGDQTITYEIEKIGPIIEGGRYGGLSVKLIGRLENIRQPFSIDFATGDPITPYAIHYNYHLMVNDKIIAIKSYNFETIVSEKLQTVVMKGLANSRCKDFYDLYIILKMHRDELNRENLNNAIQNTFEYRETQWDADEIINLLDLIKSSRIMETRWIQFSKSHPFAGNINHSDVIDEICQLVLMIKTKMKVN